MLTQKDELAASQLTYNLVRHLRVVILLAIKITIKYSQIIFYSRKLNKNYIKRSPFCRSPRVRIGPYPVFFSTPHFAAEPRSVFWQKPVTER